MISYPEHEKLHKVIDKSQIIGEFIDWLHDKKEIAFVRWEEWEEKIKPRRRPHGVLETVKVIKHKKYVPVYTKVDTLLAEFFGIDQDKIEKEKLAMIKALKGASGVD